MPLDLRSTISLDGSGFESGLKGIERGAERAGETLKGLATAAFGIYGIESAIHKTIETAERLVDTSRRLGIGLEALQEFGYAAKQNGADIEQLTTFIEKLNSTRIDPKKFESFAKLGISQPDLANLKVEDLMMKLSLNLRDRSSQEVVGPLRDIGGKGAGQMIVMLKDNLEELREEAHKVGSVISQQTLVSLKFIADEFAMLSSVMVARLAPAIEKVMEWIVRLTNIVKASGTFFGSLLGGSSVKGVKNIWDDLTTGGLFKMTKMDDLKSWLHQVSGGMGEAWQTSREELSKLNGEFDDQMAKLAAKQKQMEDFNRNPNFEIPEPKEKMPHEIKSGRLYSDSLLAVGNFLGSNSNPMISLAHQQLITLKEIARNTQWRQVGRNGYQGFPPH